MTARYSVVAPVTAFGLAILPLTAAALPLQAPGTASRIEPAAQQSARFRGGGGSTWKTGRNTHGFMGSYGGCRYRGFAGPNGYQLKKSC